MPFKGFNKTLKQYNTQLLPAVAYIDVPKYDYSLQHAFW